MATFVGVHNKIYLGHLDLTCHTRSVNFGALTRSMQDATTFCDGGYTAVKPGLISGQATIEGYQDWDADVLDDEISIAQLGSQYPITVLPNESGTVAVGDPAWLSRGVVATLNPMGGAKGEMAAFTIESAYDTAIVQGVVAHTATAVTTSGSDSGVVLAGPAAGESLYAALHVTAFDSLTSCSVVVETDDGAGFGSATSRITFSDVTGTTSEWASAAGSFSSETHVRVRYTVVGSGSITFVVAVGVI